MCDRKLFATILSEKVKQDHAVRVPDDSGGGRYKIRPKVSMPEIHDITCIAFCLRRKTGVVAGYRGGISIRQICSWLGREYRAMIDEERCKALRESRTEGPFRGLTDRDIATRFKSKGTVKCSPIQETSTLDRTLEQLATITDVIVTVPDHDTDPAAPLRGVANGVEVVVKINPTYRSDRNWRNRIVDLLTLQRSAKARIRGIDDDGKQQTIPINDEIFALDNFERDKLVAAEHLSKDALCGAPVFKDLVDYMDQNPRLFGA